MSVRTTGDHWVEQFTELSALLNVAAQGGNPVIADPSGRASGLIAMVVDPAYWSSQPRELADAMRRASDSEAPATRTREDRLASGAATSQDRLTLTVEEAAAALGTVARWRTRLCNAATSPAFASGAASSCRGQA